MWLLLHLVAIVEAVRTRVVEVEKVLLINWRRLMRMLKLLRTIVRAVLSRLKCWRPRMAAQRTNYLCVTSAARVELVELLLGGGVLRVEHTLHVLDAHGTVDAIRSLVLHASVHTLIVRANEKLSVHTALLATVAMIELMRMIAAAANTELVLTVEGGLVGCRGQIKCGLSHASTLLIHRSLAHVWVVKLGWLVVWNFARRHELVLHSFDML